MELKRVLENLEYELLNGDVLSVNIEDIAYDSRKAKEGTAFVCLCGATADGHDFASKAYDLGCRVFVVQKPLSLESDALQIKVGDTRAALALMSANFFEHPSKTVKVIGITGTKGKTTTTFILKSLLDSCGIKAGLIGTTGATWGDKKVPTVNTTPESYETEKILRQMADDGVEVCAIEVSSLGVKQHRVDGINFFCGVFTNISPDHVGGAEHATYEEYYSFKKKFFEFCDIAVGCLDDENTEDMISPATGKKIYYGFSEKADYRAENLTPMSDEDYLGVAFDYIKDGKKVDRFEVSLPGKFSVQNALASIAIMDLLGVKKNTLKSALTTISVPGRAQVLRTDTSYTIVVDYAHNGLSLESLIETVKDYKFERIITVIGSVGDRAQLRREEIGTVAGRLSDFTVFTSDDPGFEDPQKICEEMADFLKKENEKAEYIIITDRQEAIEYAISIMTDKDILLVCGKGHETVQKINGEKVPYSDYESIASGVEKRIDADYNEDNFAFKEENDFEAFDDFVKENKGAYQQASVWPKVKTAWAPHYYAGFSGEKRVLTALVLERKLPLAGKLWYVPCGPICDFENEKLIEQFGKFLKAEMKDHGAFCAIIDPLIPLRIDGEEQLEGVNAHKLFEKIGFSLNTDVDSYTYKHPVQTMIPLKDSEGNEIPADKILKGCEKGVRYSVRVGTSRGLVSKRYKADEILNNPKVIEDFMEVMGDTSDRNSFVNRDANYIKTLVETLSDSTDITIVYYDKKIDAELEAERQKRRAEVFEILPTAPQKKIRGLEDEIDVIDKNTQSYNQRVEETKSFADDRIAVAAGLTIRYGGVASCVFGGTRNVVRNNTRSSHYLNYLRMCESVDENMDFHDLGYVLCENPNPPTKENGTLGDLGPRENFVGIRDFKLSFGAKYYEFVGEYILVGNKFRYWIYKEFMPKVKKLKMKLVKLIRNIKK